MQGGREPMRPLAPQVRGLRVVLENWMWPKKTEREPSSEINCKSTRYPLCSLPWGGGCTGTDTDPHGACVCVYLWASSQWGGARVSTPSLRGVLPARTPVTLALWLSGRSRQGGGIRAGGAADCRCLLSPAGSYPVGALWTLRGVTTRQ